MKYYSAIKNEIMSFVAKRMDLEFTILSVRVSQTEKDKYHMISPTFGVLKKKKKKIPMNSFKQRHRLRKQTYGPQRERWWGGGINWEFGIDIYTLMYLK